MHAIKPALAHEGDQITYPVGRVTIAVSCIRPGYAYRAAAHHSGTAGRLGAEIAELSQSWPTEHEARLAARRIVRAFTGQPADQPFAVLVEKALASIAAQLDERIERALGGGDGTGRQAIGLGRLTRAREALKTPAQRITEAELVERLRADLEAYDVDEAYRAAVAGAADLPPVDPKVGRDQDFDRWNRNMGLIAADRAAEQRPARNWADLKARHAAAIERDRYQHIT